VAKGRHSARIACRVGSIYLYISRASVRLSVRLSVCLSDCPSLSSGSRTPRCGGFAAVGPASRRHRLIAVAARRRIAAATAAPPQQRGVRRPMRAVSRCQLTYEAEHRLVYIAPPTERPRPHHETIISLYAHADAILKSKQGSRTYQSPFPVRLIQPFEAARIQ